MNKLEYLNQLETILKKQHLDKADIDDIIRDYAEFFEEGRRQGESDQEIAAKLGSPELIAQQIMEENGYKVAITPTMPKNEFEFKLPKFKMPKFGFGKKEESEDGKSEEEKREKKIYNKHKDGGAPGCLGSGLLMILKFFALLIVGGTLTLVFGAAALGVGCAFIGLVCAFIAVILGFFAAAVASHFLTLPVTVFAIALCIALLALIICLGALLLMLMAWCGKLFLQAIRCIMDWPHKPVIVTVPQADAPVLCEEAVSGEEGELNE